MKYCKLRNVMLLDVHSASGRVINQTRQYIYATFSDYQENRNRFTAREDVCAVLF